MPRTKEEQSEYNKQYRLKNAERIVAQRKSYREENREVISQRKREYRETYRDEILKKKLDYYYKNKDQILKKFRDKRLINIEYEKKKARDRYHATKHQTREKRNEYARKNQSKRNEKAKIYNKKRRLEDPMFLVMGRLRSRIRSALVGYGWTKNKRTGEMLGCTKEHFIKHLESLFLDGMGWHNRESWHIDHIIPLSSAKNIEDMEKLNHYTNLRPLWALDNLSKGSKYEC